MSGEYQIRVLAGYFDGRPGMTAEQVVAELVALDEERGPERILTCRNAGMTAEQVTVGAIGSWNETAARIRRGWTSFPVHTEKRGEGWYGARAVVFAYVTGREPYEILDYIAEPTRGGKRK